MTKAFVPLTVSRSAPSAASGFQPLSAAVPGASPAPAAAFAATALPQHAGHAPTPPRVTLLREGDQVTHIRIECGCGEIVELACAY